MILAANSFFVGYPYLFSKNKRYEELYHKLKQDSIAEPCLFTPFSIREEEKAGNPNL